MYQYLIKAHDGTDDQALQRRMQVRSDHFEGARQLKKIITSSWWS